MVPRLLSERLRSNLLYLKWKKCKLYAETVDCLGHKIDSQGIHSDQDKLNRIHEWQVPHTYNDIQQFVGLVNYIETFLPDIMAYTGLLMSITQSPVEMVTTASEVF